MRIGREDGGTERNLGNSWHLVRHKSNIAGNSMASGTAPIYE
jgi:hypothetical protein